MTDEDIVAFEALWDTPPASLFYPARDGEPGVGLPRDGGAWRDCRIWQGYLDASGVLLDAILDRQPNACGLIYPALFALRHGFEVALKWHIRDAGGAVPRQAGHDLRLLADAFRETVAGLEDMDDIARHLCDVADELAAIDPRALAFRYATALDGSDIALPATAWDLRRLCFSVGMLTTCLDNLSDWVAISDPDYRAMLRDMDG